MKDILCQRLWGRKIWVCPGGVPLPVPVKPLIHTPILYCGGKFWVAPPWHTQFLALRDVWRRWNENEMNVNQTKKKCVKNTCCSFISLILFSCSAICFWCCSSAFFFSSCMKSISCWRASAWKYRKRNERSSADSLFHKENAQLYLFTLNSRHWVLTSQTQMYLWTSSKGMDVSCRTRHERTNGRTEN